MSEQALIYSLQRQVPQVGEPAHSTGSPYTLTPLLVVSKSYNQDRQRSLGDKRHHNLSTEALILITTISKEFLQSCQIPVGSNSPSKKPHEPPKPVVVAVSKSQVS